MIVGIILAAGESRRMRASQGVDMSKQLLPWKNTTMIQQVVDNAKASQLDMILVVLGYGADEIKAKLRPSPEMRLFINPDFKEGMSSSLKCGIRNLPEDAEAFMILLGDQPLVNSEIINTVIDGYRLTKHGIVIPVYNGHRGHPVIFDLRYKKELLSIEDQIARETIRSHADDVFEANVTSPNIFIDIDTFQEYQEAKAKAEKG